MKLESGVDLQLRDLKIGDKIQVMSREGKIGFSEVMIFADYKPNVTKVPYILIETERPSKKLSLTSSHLIFTSNSTATKFKAKQAGSVVPGEIVLVSNGSELVSSLVRRVSLIERTGMIAPVTIQGNLIVDEVLTTMYYSDSTPDSYNCKGTGVKHTFFLCVGKIPSHWTFHCSLVVPSIFRTSLCPETSV